MNKNFTHQEERNFTRKVSISTKKALAFVAALIGVDNMVVAQNTDLPNPDANQRTAPAGSIIITMDNTNQGNADIFNLKAYGLVVTLMNIKNNILNKGLLAVAMTSLLLIADCQQAKAQSGVAKTNADKVNMSALNAVSTDTSTVDSLIVPALASLGDFVWIDNNVNGIQDAGEPGLANVEVVLYDSVLQVIDTRYTDDSGYYHFRNIPVPAASSKTFIVGFNNIPPNYAYTNLIADSLSRHSNSKSDTISGRTKPFVLHAGEVRRDIDGGIKNAPGVVLPLIINQFNGNYDDGFIQLGWNTYSEINIDHFDVERSTDGINFRQIGRVTTVSGQLNSNINYRYLDITAPRGTNYYRLAMVDNNGNYTYSKSIMVNVDIKGISVMIVYPNPFSRRVQIRINSDKAEKVAINIINSSGVLMSTQEAHTQVGDNNIAISKVDNLPGGVYYIEVVSSTRSLKTKVMKLN